MPPKNSDKNSETERSRQRRKEDRKFTSVIVRRIDETLRHPDDTLKKAIEEGTRHHTRKIVSLFLSALAAGLILGFSAMAVAVATQLAGQTESAIMSRIFPALFYPLGFIVCIMSGTQLFTEQTALAVYPVLDRKVSILSLFKNLSVVLTGNFLGTLISAWMLANVDSVVGAKEGYTMVLEHLLHFSSHEILISSVLAGWLMAQGGWLILTTHSSLAQIVCIYIPTLLIGIGGLHHSIAGSAELFVGMMFQQNWDIVGALRFLGVATIGNFLGGCVFVAILNYGHIRHTE